MNKEDRLIRMSEILNEAADILDEDSDGILNESRELINGQLNNNEGYKLAAAIYARATWIAGYKTNIGSNNHSTNGNDTIVVKVTGDDVTVTMEPCKYKEKMNKVNESVKKYLIKFAKRYNKDLSWFERIKLVVHNGVSVATYKWTVKFKDQDEFSGEEQIASTY